MTQTISSFYREQAARQQGDADASALANVRARNQRAADAWTSLAERGDRLDSLRAARDLPGLSEGWLWSGDNATAA